MKKRKKLKKSKNLESKLNKYFLLSWKKIFTVIIVWIVSIVFHNLSYAFVVETLDMNIDDEVFFFILAVFLIPLYLLISLIYTLIAFIKKKSLLKFKRE